MSAPDEILSGFDKIKDKPYGTRFYKADLHFHTPSSSDGRGKDKYGFNPYGISYLENETLDLLATIKSIDNLDALKGREDIRKLDLAVLERLERKILHDMDLLQDIKSLKSGRNATNRRELEYKILLGVRGLDDLQGIQNDELKIFNCEDIQGLLGLRSRENQEILKEIENMTFKGDNTLEGKFYDIRLLRDHKYMEHQVPVEGYPRTLREFRERILAYAQLKARQIVERFREEQLDIVAVTDHNGVGTLWSDGEYMDLAAPSWYEMIDDAARDMNREKGTSLVILPGVEISTDGVHILAVFPPQIPRRKAHYMICELVESAGIFMEEWCINDAVGNVSPYGVINMIHEKKGIGIPAHIDAVEKGLLEMYKLTVGALEDVVSNQHLRAVEVVNADRFREGTIRNKLEAVRRDNDLPSLAFFQGSDSHDLLHIAKRSTSLKMTAPSFSGLQAAIKMPSSRVRFSSDRKEWDGLYIRGVVFDHPLLGKQELRLNRNLNCISGKVGVGKTTLHNLMQASVLPEFDTPFSFEHSPEVDGRQGYATLFVEKIKDIDDVYPPEKKVAHYAFHRKVGQDSVGIYHLDVDSQGKATAASLLTEIKLREKPQESQPPQFLFDPEMFEDKEMNAYLDSLDLQPKFYNAEEMKKIIADRWVDAPAGQTTARIRDESLFQKFLRKYFHQPTPENVQAFNRTFFMPRFLEGDKDKRFEEMERKKRGLIIAGQKLKDAQAVFESSAKTDADKAALKDATTEMARLEREIARERRPQLLELSLKGTDASPSYRLALNMQWRGGDPVMVDFFSLNESQRRTVMVCMIIMCSRLPVIIDAPEQEFDNDDMTKYLVPLILENKEMRQILLFTNHPILAVNTDPDNYLLMHRQVVKTKSSKNKDTVPVTSVLIDSGFAIDAPPVQKELLLEVLEGDLRAFRKRASQYE